MKCKLKDSDDVGCNPRNLTTSVVGGCQRTRANGDFDKEDMADVFKLVFSALGGI